METSLQAPDTAGRPLEEWSEAYAKVESYFGAMQIRNKLLLSQLVYRVLERASQRAPQELDRPVSQLAMEETFRVINEWFSEIMGGQAPDPHQPLFVQGRLALQLSNMPGKWQDQFLRPGPWPAGFVAAMKENFVRSGPDFQISHMRPEPLDLGPVAALTNLKRRPYLKMFLVWGFVACWVWIIFRLTR